MMKKQRFCGRCFLYLGKTGYTSREVIFMDYNPYAEMPAGFVSALAANSEAMEKFAAYSGEQKKQAVDGAKQIRSKLEMRNYVNQIAEGGMM